MPLLQRLCVPSGVRLSLPARMEQHQGPGEEALAYRPGSALVSYTPKTQHIDSLQPDVSAVPVTPATRAMLTERWAEIPSEEALAHWMGLRAVLRDFEGVAGGLALAGLQQESLSAAAHSH